MANEFWINLPVRDLDKSRRFFTTIGFSLHPSYGESSEMAGLVMGEKGVMVMLFPEETFSQFAHNEIADPLRGTEVLFSLDAESREEVDLMAERVVTAGGETFGGPGEKNGMYGFGFTDPDGHRWNVITWEQG